MSQPDGDMGALHRPDRLRPAVPGGGVGAGPRPRQSSIRRVLQDLDPVHDVLVVVESKRVGRCVCAPVPAPASSRNALAIVRCPVDELTKNDREGLSGSSQRVLDLRRGGVQDRPADESVPLESTQGDCEHALGYSLDRAQQLPKAAPPRAGGGGGGGAQQTNRTATTSKTNGKQPLGAAYHLNLLPRFAGEGVIMNPLR